MDWADGLVAIAASMAATWLFVMSRRFQPRIGFKVNMDFVRHAGGGWFVDLVAHLENTGEVPVLVESLGINLRGLDPSTDSPSRFPSSHNGQVEFPRLLLPLPDGARSQATLRDGRYVALGPSHARGGGAGRRARMILEPTCSLDYRFAFHVPDRYELLLLHGILEYGQPLGLLRAVVFITSRLLGLGRNLCHRADKMFALPRDPGESPTAAASE